MTSSNAGIEALLPCPFCEFAVIPTRSGLSGNHADDCFMRQIAVDTSNPKAITAWNRRAADTASQARVKVLEEALEPFADAVFNDNGDMTVNFSAASSDDFIAAYFALRRTALQQTKEKGNG